MQDPTLSPAARGAIETLKDYQAGAEGDLLDALNERGWSSKDDIVRWARAEYVWYTQQILAAYRAAGIEPHVGDVDPAMFESYSDIYKDRHGFRPRGFVTWDDAKRWLEAEAISIS